MVTWPTVQKVYCNFVVTRATGQSQCQANCFIPKHVLLMLCLQDDMIAGWKSTEELHFFHRVLDNVLLSLQQSASCASVMSPVQQMRSREVISVEDMDSPLIVPADRSITVKIRTRLGIKRLHMKAVSGFHRKICSLRFVWAHRLGDLWPWNFGELQPGFQTSLTARVSNGRALGELVTCYVWRWCLI